MASNKEKTGLLTDMKQFAAKNIIQGLVRKM